MSSRRSRSGGSAIGKTFEPVVEVGAEAARGDLGVQVAVRRGDDAHVDAQAARAADALELALLQHAQQLRLRLERQLADLVEEQRAAVGELEAAAALLDRAGEGALLVAEELALEQLARQRGAVELDERALAARALLVDRARDELLAGAGLALDQHGAVRRARPARSARARAAAPATRRSVASRSERISSTSSWMRRLRPAMRLDLAPQRDVGADACEQLLGLERLRHVVHRTFAERAHLLERLA